MIKKAKRTLAVLLALSMTMSLAAVAAQAEEGRTLICLQEEHAHGDECYALTCGKEEGEGAQEGHAHTDDCYGMVEIPGGITCQEEHEHAEDCPREDPTFERGELNCDQPETETVPGHVHTGDCQGLDCGKEEHTHAADCYEAKPEEPPVEELALTITGEDMEAELPIKEAIERTGVADLTAVKSLTVTTEGEGRLSMADNEYIMKNFPALEVLDETECHCVLSELDPKIAQRSGLSGDLEKFGGLSKAFNLKELYIPRYAQVIASYGVTNMGVTSLTIPEGVLVLESGCLSDNAGWTEDLVIPDSVKYIGNNTFGVGKAISCGALVLSDSVVYIDTNAFRNRIFSGDLVLPDSLEVLGSWVFTPGAFEGGTWTLGSGLRQVGAAALSGICSGNSGTFVLPASIELKKPDGSVADGTFSKSPFSKLVFEEGREDTGKSLAQKWTGLTEVVLPESIVRIENFSFAECTALEQIVLPQGLKTINQCAFFNSGLRGILLPASVTGKLGDLAFQGMPEGSVIYVQEPAQRELITRGAHGHANWGTCDHTKVALAVTDGGLFATDVTALEPTAQFVLGELVTPVKVGYIFQGWYGDSEFSGQPLTQVVPGETYYAKWEPCAEHDAELVKSVAPTCTEDGVDNYYCAKCGELQRTETVSTSGHSYESRVTREPTTSREGQRTHTCTACGDSYTTAIPRLEAPSSGGSSGGSTRPSATPAPTPTPVESQIPAPVETPVAAPESPEPAPEATPIPEEEELTEQETPLAQQPEELIPEASEEDLADEEIPLADVPKTGDVMTPWLLLSLLSALGLAVLTLTGRKKDWEA